MDNREPLRNDFSPRFVANRRSVEPAGGRGVRWDLPQCNRKVCNAQFFLDSDLKQGSNSQIGHLQCRPIEGFAYAPSGGCTHVKSAFPDDALPGLRGPDGLSCPPAGFRRCRRHGLRLPPLRCGIDSHLGAPQIGRKAGCGLAQGTASPPRRTENVWSCAFRETRRSAQSHLFEHRAAEQAVRIVERLQHFEVVVTLADDQLDRLAGGFHRGGKVA
jgi:hypothetical protein